MLKPVQALPVPAASAVSASPASRETTNKAPVDSSKALKWIVIGDWGTGDETQLRVARVLGGVADTVHPDFVVSAGDQVNRSSGLHVGVPIVSRVKIH